MRVYATFNFLVNIIGKSNASFCSELLAKLGQKQKKIYYKELHSIKVHR